MFADKVDQLTQTTLYSSASYNAGTGTTKSGSGISTLEYDGELMFVLSVGSGSGAGNKVRVDLEQGSASDVNGTFSVIGGGSFGSVASHSIAYLGLDSTYLDTYIRPKLYQTGSMAVRIDMVAKKNRI